eukprot:TRINITY_DN33624_c0_g1_i1.p1 TRINITY_DN33624_c0_g1~~TRINITY_DN33624_c0_g1_i1.p1  ORF type:complete len:548 (-),score=89.37 TRINITY_DN33624_c0_g1_i1:3-1646(-)
MATVPSILWWLTLQDSAAFQAAAADRTCHDFTPAVHELRGERPEGWSMEELRGRRWTVAIQQSAGGEEEVEGFASGKCVVRAWSREERLAGGANKAMCLQRCADEPGCLGILWGRIEGLAAASEHCFLAGVGDSSVVMEQPCPNPSRGCPLAVSSDVLVDLAPTLQCWQRRWQRCDVSAPPRGSQAPRGGMGQAEWLVAWERAGAALHQLLTQVKRQLQPVVKMSRAFSASLFKAAGRRSRKSAAGATPPWPELEGGLESPAGQVAWFVALSAAAFAIGQCLRSLRIKASESLRAPDQVLEVPFSQSHEVTPSSAGNMEEDSVPTSPAQEPCSSSRMPSRSPSPFASAGLEPQDELQLPLGDPVVLGPAETACAEMPVLRRRSRDATPPPRPAQSPLIQSAGSPLLKHVWSPVVEEIIDLDSLEEERGTASSASRPHDGVVQPSQMSAKALRIKRFWDAIDNSPEPAEEDEHTKGSLECQVLKLLNHPDIEVIKKVRFIGEKTAAQIQNYRYREGDLAHVSDLWSKVGLKEGLVNKVLREYSLPELR